MKTIFRFFKIIAKQISKLPLCGRLMIKPLLYNTYGASGYKKIVLVVLSYVVLIGLVLGHSYQANLGYTFFCNNEHVVTKVFMLLYMIVNILVTYVQLFLCYRLFVHCIKQREMFKQHTEDIHKFIGFTPVQVMLMTFITLSGQIMFIVLQ
jgi:hypothetical protein